MPINFPSSPSNGQIYEYGNNVWTWDGSKWLLTIPYRGYIGATGWTGSTGIRAGTWGAT